MKPQRWSNWLSPKSRRPKVIQSNYDNNTVYSDFFNSNRKCKAEDCHDVCVQYVAVSCCLSATTDDNEQAGEGASKKKTRDLTITGSVSLQNDDADTLKLTR
jgi:hypothetical protein